MNMYVGNLSYSVTEDELRSMFVEYGDVVSAKLIMDRETGRSKGFGFVEMSNNSDAQKAMDDLNGRTLDGRALTVNQARPREDRSRSGGRGGYGGGGGRNRY
jgi:RNA recognition motif-containing protein